MLKNRSKKEKSGLIATLGFVIGIIGSFITIYTAVGILGFLISFIIAGICWLISFKLYRDSSNDNVVNPNINIKTHGNQSPGIVGGDYKVVKNERP